MRYQTYLTCLALGATALTAFLTEPRIFVEPAMAVYDKTIGAYIAAENEKQRKVKEEKSRKIAAEAQKAIKKQEAEEVAAAQRALELEKLRVAAREAAKAADIRRQKEAEERRQRERRQARFMADNVRGAPFANTPALVYKVQFGRYRYSLDGQMYLICPRTRRRTWQVSLTRHDAPLWVSWAYYRGRRKGVQYLTNEHRIVSGRRTNPWPPRAGKPNCLAVRADSDFYGKYTIEFEILASQS